MKLDLSRRCHAWILANASKPHEERLTERKNLLFSGLGGKVLEIGPGTGVNLKYYPDDLDWTGVEPNPYMMRYLHATASGLRVNIKLQETIAEAMQVADESMDFVVATLVLCSVSDPAAVLRKVLRALKPGGRFIFVEHVAAPTGTRLRRIQTLIRPLWKIIGNGCCPDRPTWSLLEQAGFSSVQMDHFTLPFPIVGPHISGTAIK